MKSHVQKKKTTTKVVLDILFKFLVAIAVIIFGYILYDKADFSTNSLSLTSKKKTPPQSHTPSELKWFNDFKGIENVPDKNAKKNNGSSSSGHSGFKYEGFKK